MQFHLQVSPERPEPVRLCCRWAGGGQDTKKECGPIFRGELLVSGSVASDHCNIYIYIYLPTFPLFMKLHFSPI